ncbi:hypothetical protein CCHR01_16413 [Colletotrichum chrysophilum]|uniref:Uncharacterized protein n=1 Tax=Colletotrichum chrysophilum TaxID=1836956 RepID=A0AAD9EAH9_9PEZI|nr:hypothetical protein CCHR01_16413 [Colletotrichum chrysophilum]
MWDILFPGYPHPRSPYLDPALSKQVKSLCDYVGANGPSIILQELERNGALHQLCTNGQSELLREAMGQAVQLMIEESCVRLFSGVTPGASQQTHIPKPPSHTQDVSYAETFSALSTDSGVALRTPSTASDRRSQSQRQPMLSAPRQCQGLTTLAHAQAVIEPSSFDEQVSMGSTSVPGPTTSVDLVIPEHYAETHEGCIQEGEVASWEIGQDDLRFQLNPVDTRDELEDLDSILNRMLDETGVDYGGV